MQTYRGKGAYRRQFDGHVADNTEMYNCLTHHAGKRAFCVDCDRPIASWDESADADSYEKTDYRALG